jgi:hypothetical protein
MVGGVCPITQEDVDAIPLEERFSMEGVTYDRQALRIFMYNTTSWPILSPVTRQPIAADDVFPALFGANRGWWPTPRDAKHNRIFNRAIELAGDDLVPSSHHGLLHLHSIASAADFPLVAQRVHDHLHDTLDLQRKALGKERLLWMTMHHPFLCSIFGGGECRRCHVLVRRAIKEPIPLARMVGALASPTNMLELLDLMQLRDGGRVPSERVADWHAASQRFVDTELGLGLAEGGGRLAWACFVALKHPFLCDDSDDPCTGCGALLERVIGAATDEANHDVVLWSTGCPASTSFVHTSSHFCFSSVLFICGTDDRFAARPAGGGGEAQSA